MESVSSSRTSTSSSRSRTLVGSRVSSLSSDILCAIFALLDHFELARCSVVCRSWYDVIQKSTLMADLYYKKHSSNSATHDEHTPSRTSIKVFLEKLAVEDHISALANGSSEIHQWTAHSAGVNQCRMKRGMIATGVGEKTVRLWSAESYKCLGDYLVPDMSRLIDFDFDESKIVGLVGSQLCIWRRHGKRSLFQSTPSRTLCMRYIDPEAVIGGEDGRAHILDMYSGSCSRIIRIHGGPITCLALDEHLILGGSSSGRITLADISSGEWVASLKSSYLPLGITSLSFKMRSHLVFAGSTAGYSHCWDLRTLRPLWETRISSNVIYATDHLSTDSSTLAAGGIDGVLRILDQKTGEIIANYVVGGGNTMPLSAEKPGAVEKRKAMAISQDTRLDTLPKHRRPSITCLAVGMRKIVTTHNEKYIKVWKFRK